jgi:NhaP-type Na+/H+ or K+/H+ antiporter
LLISIALAYSSLKPLPISPEILYLLFGILLGPAGVGLIILNPLANAPLLERLTEIVVLISLFSAGLKLRTPLYDGRWKLPVRLASLSMIITVLLVAVVGVFGLGLPLGAAVLLGAVLAPTDPVLASEVQVKNPLDRDRLRFSLTGEAGMNDGTAFPFVMLGLGLLGLHELGEGGWRWLTIDVVWAITAGFGSGWLWGTLIGHLVLFLRRRHQETLGLDDFLVLGLIALAYGVAMLISTYGFLAVFAAGLALRRIERRAEGIDVPKVEQVVLEANKEQVATKPEDMPAYMAQALLGFSEQLERVGTVGVVVLIGGMLSAAYWDWRVLWFIPILFLVIRPIAVFVGLWGTPASKGQRSLMAWFGIRGIGSIYYLMYAIVHGLSETLSTQLVSLVFPIITASIVIHGISVTPLMRRYGDGDEKAETGNEEMVTT